MGRYSYDELRAAALAPTATDKDLKAMADWLFEFDPDAWNGECWDLGDNMRLFPVYTETEPDEWETTGYEIR